MLRLVWRQLRGRAGRSIALLAGVLVATTGFVVLTGAITTSRLQLGERLERETRAAYDILVRPTGSRTPLEADRRMVQPNYLSGLFGGISTGQYEQIRELPGVEIAAPVAMVGYVMIAMSAEFDLTEAVDRTAERQVIRVDPTFLAERGLSRAVAAPRYVYLTRNPLLQVVPENGVVENPARYSDGRHYPFDPCGVGFPVPREVLPDGRTEPVCDLPPDQRRPGGAVTDLAHTELLAARLLPDGRFDNSPHSRATTPDAPVPVTDRLVLPVSWRVPFLLAAVDPAAEDRLLGLADAVVAGRPLHADEPAVDRAIPGFAPSRAVPVLATSRPYVDGTITASYQRLRPPRIAGLHATELAGVLDAAPATPAGTGAVELADTYQAQIRTLMADEISTGSLDATVQAGPTGYDPLPDGSLRPRTVPPDPAVYTLPNVVGQPKPWLADDVSFRPLRQLTLRSPTERTTLGWRPVGMFDPERLTAFGDLVEVPLETYQPPALAGADDTSRAALGDRQLLPSGNPGGYLSSPPLLLTSLGTLPKLLEGQDAARAAEAPISAIRIRVDGVDGVTAQAAERVRLTAEQIALRTGLDVDVTFGSSPAPQTVELAPGTFGRPALRLQEGWSALGVGSLVVQAVDRKSIGLFLLVLVVCALFLANAVSAAVRDRRSELAMLSCLGWPARRIGALILGEVATLGLTAGVLALGLTVPLAALLNVDVGWRQAVLAVPVALLLAVVAGAVPALRASRTHPAAALRPAVVPARRIRRPPGYSASPR